MCIKLSRVVNIGLEEDCMFCEAVPAIEDVIEVCLTLSADIGKHDDCVGSCLPFDESAVCFNVFGVDRILSFGECWYTF